MGDVIADAQLASTSPADFGGAVVAFMNPGGIRADLVCSQACSQASPAPVTYNQLFNVQPFNNVMTVKTMTGDMIYRLLEQQFTGANGILQVSDGFAYSWSPTTTPHVVPGSVTIDGVAVDKTASYRVAMNNFLASGGDGFTVFNEGPTRSEGRSTSTRWSPTSSTTPRSGRDRRTASRESRRAGARGMTSEAGASPASAPFGSLRGEQLVDVVDDVLGLHARVVDDAAVAVLSTSIV
jgi:2',3'-cyclic-nucleotide 2'-phosphodiesterase (5'-nucleotidase family)